MLKRLPKKLHDAPAEAFKNVDAVFFDIDDTFSGGKGKHGELAAACVLPEAYAALWNLYRAGLMVVPVTGRPAGWCDMIARMWPVTGVVGENGAFYCKIDYSGQSKARGSYAAARLVKTYLESKPVREKNAKRLEALHREILKAFPGARTASDQAYREFDLAIDYCEDVPRWGDVKVRRLLEFCRDRGASAKLSSIHVNIWFGKYDKLTCVRRVLRKSLSDEQWNKGESELFSSIAYLGDSPNDEPFFERLPFTVGVANVKSFLKEMKHAPAYVTEGKGGLGFAEFAARLLQFKL